MTMTAVRRGTTVGRGWLIAALAVAVAVLLGSVLAVVAWGGALGQVTPTRSGSDSGVTQFRGGDGNGPGMMGGNWRAESRAERRADCLELRRGWRDS